MNGLPPGVPSFDSDIVCWCFHCDGESLNHRAQFCNRRPGCPPKV